LKQVIPPLCLFGGEKIIGCKEGNRTGIVKRIDGRDFGGRKKKVSNREKAAAHRRRGGKETKGSPERGRRGILIRAILSGKPRERWSPLRAC